MILKSFQIENNIKNILKFKFILIYGENVGLKDTLKKKIIKLDNKAEIINLYQDDIAKNRMSDEVKNISLFSENKIIIVNQVSDKIITEIEDLLDCKENVKIILIGEMFDKRSKLRSLFEKNTNLAIIPCYNDNDITLRKLVQNELIGFKNLNSNTINMILNYSNSNRKTILNNVEKIKSFYEKKILTEYELDKLLNSDRNEVFDNIRDAALNGDITKLNKLLGEFVFANEDAFLYLNTINYRLLKILEIHKQNEIYKDLEISISKIKPPIFWKDKPIYTKLLKKWHKQRVKEALVYLREVEKQMKSNSVIDVITLVKNSITNICTNSWSYF